MRTVEPMETAAGLIPSDVLDAHMLKPPPHERLMAIGAEIQAAADAEDHKKVRALREEKKYLERAQEQETAALLASAAARRIAPPAKNEEKRLEKRLAHLQSEITRTQGLREKLLARLKRAPEHEKLPDQIDAAEARLLELATEQQIVEARQDEIERYHDEQRRREERAAKQRAWEQAAPTYRTQLQSAVEGVISAWRALDSGVREIDQLRERLRNPVSPAESPQTTAAVARIADATGGRLQCAGGRWIVRLEGGKR